MLRGVSVIGYICGPTCQHSLYLFMPKLVETVVKRLKKINRYDVLHVVLYASCANEYRTMPF